MEKAHQATDPLKRMTVGKKIILVHNVIYILDNILRKVLVKVKLIFTFENATKNN